MYTLRVSTIIVLNLKKKENTTTRRKKRREDPTIKYNTQKKNEKMDYIRRRPTAVLFSFHFIYYSPSIAIEKVVVVIIVV